MCECIHGNLKLILIRLGFIANIVAIITRQQIRLFKPTFDWHSTNAKVWHRFNCSARMSLLGELDCWHLAMMIVMDCSSDHDNQIMQLISITTTKTSQLYVHQIK